MATTAPDKLAAFGEEEDEERRVARPKSGFIGTLNEFGELAEFFVAAIAAIPSSFRYLAEALGQAKALVLGTSPLLFVMYIFMGIVTINTGYFLLFPLGAVDYIGAIGAFGIHVSAVIMFGYVFSSKVCGGFVAQIGAMKINQEIDALESTGVDPMRYVVGTRLIAVLMYIPIATVVGLLGYTTGCFLDAIVILHATSQAGYFEFHWISQGLSDQFFVFFTIAVTGIVTAITACFYGLRTSGGPAAVGDSVAQAVKMNLVLANLVGGFMVVLWYANSAGVPIGG